jgi:hypothetical protein
MKYEFSLKIKFGSGELCNVDNEIADIKFGYVLVVNILGMKLY